MLPLIRSAVTTQQAKKPRVNHGGGIQPPTEEGERRGHGCCSAADEMKNSGQLDENNDAFPDTNEASNQRKMVGWTDVHTNVTWLFESCVGWRLFTVRWRQC